MWPTLVEGDRAEILSCPGSELRVGQVVLARRDDALLVHRVVSIANGQLVLQGDNCTRPDEALSLERVVGVVGRIQRGKRTLNGGQWDLPRLPQPLHRLAFRVRSILRGGRS